MLRVLSLLEARVLGVLVEKERTVPDSYPLTLNALVAGCNQKSSRDPVLNAAETDARAAVDGLKSMLLALEHRERRSRGRQLVIGDGALLLGRAGDRGVVVGLRFLDMGAR